MAQRAKQTLKSADNDTRPIDASDNRKRDEVLDSPANSQRNPLHQVRHLSVQKFVDLAVQTAQDYAKHEALLQRSSSLLKRVSAAFQLAGEFVLPVLKQVLQATLTGIDAVEKWVATAARVVGGLFVTSVHTSLVFTAKTLFLIGRSVYLFFTPSGFRASVIAAQEFLHHHVFDRYIEKYMFIPAQSPSDLKDLTIRSTHRKRGADYRPSPARVFRWAMNALPKDLSRYTFVDFGAGRGRVLLLASRRKFKKVTGVEFAQELYEDTMMNIAQFPRSLMQCRDVDCHHLTATRMPIPEGPLVLYFHHPFDREVFSRVLRNIEQSLERTPRSVYVVTVDYDVEDLIAPSGLFARVSFSLTDRAIQALLSHLEIRVYKASGS